MKTAISIPDALFEAGEQIARRLGVSRSELYQRALRAYLREHRGDGVTEALNELYSDRGETARVDPVLEAIQRASIASEDWPQNGSGSGSESGSDEGKGDESDERQDTGPEDAPEDVPIDGPDDALLAGPEDDLEDGPDDPPGDR
jgi:predicted transcriptional regulator